MTNEQQEKEIYLKILKVASEFLKTGASIEEVSKTTKISSSSVQRYLNDRRIIEVLGQKEYDQIQNMLKIRKQEALRKGGINSVSNNEVVKDSLGHFNGVRKK